MLSPFNLDLRATFLNIPSRIIFFILMFLCTIPSITNPKGVCFIKIYLRKEYQYVRYEN